MFGGFHYNFWVPYYDFLVPYQDFLVPYYDFLVPYHDFLISCYAFWITELNTLVIKLYYQTFLPKVYPGLRDGSNYVIVIDYSKIV